MTAIEGDELRAWLRLTTTVGVSRSTVRRLLRAFGSPDAVLFASAAQLRAVGGPTAALLASTSHSAVLLQERAAQWLASSTPAIPRRLVPLGDPSYPASLLHSPDPPLLLWAEGRVELLHQPALAIVGSRHPTPQGLENTRAFTRELATSGLTIVSGLAAGIDGAAHDEARRHPASTVAVVGTGLDRVYPRRHEALAMQLRAQGLLVSEYPLGAPPRAEHFPQRNRIIAALAGGTLVVEAALASGSLITARQAADMGREVFAVPGSIHSPQSKGCHALLKQGAKLVETASDVLEELGGFQGASPPSSTLGTSLTVPNDALWPALSHDPVDLDTLALRTGRTLPDVQALLLQLELDGQVARLPGQRFQRLNAA